MLRKHGLAILVLCGFGTIYAWGEGYFSPSSIFQHDEYMVLISPIQMYTRGDWIVHQTSSAPPPGRHDYFQTMLGPPHCFHYIFIAIVHTFYLVGHLFGYYATPFDLINHSHLIRLIGRTLVILCSLGALVMTYRIGQFVFGSKRVAIISMLLMGISQYYFFSSKIAKVDVPMIFFVTLSMYFLLRASQEGKTSQFVWSGLFCGLAAATKLPGTFMALSITFVYVIRVLKKQESYFPGKLLAAGLATLLGFLGTNPNLVIYFDDFLWAIESFRVDLRAQGGIAQPWYHYYMTWDSIRYLVTVTMPNMFVGKVATYFAIGGFFGIVFRRRFKEIVLVSFPVFYILSNLPMLVSQVYREYHVCIFAMALLSAYGIHYLYSITVEKVVSQPFLRLVGLSLALGFILKAQILSANRYNYYATKPSNKELAAQWMEKNIPEGSRVLISNLVSVDARKFPQEDFSIFGNRPSWRENIGEQFDYALIIPYKASSLDSYCSQNKKLIRIFPALSTGYAGINLYALNADAKAKVGKTKTMRDNTRGLLEVKLTGENPLLQVGLNEKCRKHTAHTIWGSINGFRFAAVLPLASDSVCLRIPGIYNGDAVACEYTVLPFALPLRHQVASIELLEANEQIIAKEFTITDGSKRTVFSVDPTDLIWKEQFHGLEHRIVYNPLKYFEDDSESNCSDPVVTQLWLKAAAVENHQVVSLLRPDNSRTLRIEIEHEFQENWKKWITFHVEQKKGSDVVLAPVDFVKVRIERQDATRSTFLFQNFPYSSEPLILPPVELGQEDQVQFEFVMRGSSPL